MKIIVCAKQVPDTNEVKIDPVKGTLIREGVPSILNPDDANALEAALALKDEYGGEVHVISMGPGQAKYMLRECLAMGADGAVLLSSRVFGGADTYVTANTVAEGIRKIGGYDIIFAGRQAIDGDTAQVGPQTAEKLNLPQITYAEELIDINRESVTVKRRLERGIEVVQAKLPVMITVHGSAPDCRPRHAKLTMKYKHARTTSELQEDSNHYTALRDTRPYLDIKEWTVADLNADDAWLGLGGSPTKVKKIDNVVLTHKDATVMTSSEEDINVLMKELIASHVIG
jgi:electron transfer flavoprotein beta subunit